MRNFNIRKTIQVLDYIQRKTHLTNYMALMKLVFFADRKSLRTYGIPVLFDNYVAMKLGPVCSNTYDMLVKDSLFLNVLSEEENKDVVSCITQLNTYDVEIKSQGSDYLSKSDMQALDFAITIFGGFSPFELADITHIYPEWSKYKKAIEDGSIKSIPMYYKDFFSNPEKDNELLKKYFDMKDPFEMDQEDLKTIRDFYLEHYENIA